jgi:glycosyltransferase involved in cell wall biosynthesis
MKIAVDGAVFQEAGTGIPKGVRCLYENAARLTRSLDVTVVHRGPLKCTFSPRIKSAQIGVAVPNYFWRALALPAYLARVKPEFVHFVHLPWKAHVRVPRLTFGSKIVLTLHDVLPLTIPNYFASEQDELAYRKRVQNDLDRSDLVLTISKFSKKQILRNFNVDARLVVIYYAPTVEKSSEYSTPPSQSYHDYFLYVGGYDKRKGIESMLKIFIELHEHEKLQSRLLLVGSAQHYSQEVKNLLHAGQRKNAVAELGYVPDSVLANLYANAKALIYPSKFEGFGLPPVEAMALGCPVITTKCTSIPEICENAVYYIDPENEEAFRSSILDVEKSLELRDKLARKGLEQAKKFTWDNAAKTFLDETLRLVAETS